MPPVSFGLTLLVGTDGKSDISAGDSFGSAHTGGGHLREQTPECQVQAHVATYGSRETIPEVDVR